MTEGRRPTFASTSDGDPPPHASDGFVLVEILIGLMIIGLAAAYAFPTLSGALAWSRSADRSVMALVHARSLLDRIGHDIPLATPPLDGSIADLFVWRLVVMPYDVVPRPGGHDLTTAVAKVTVSWPRTAGRAGGVDLTTLILPPSAP